MPKKTKTKKKSSKREPSFYKITLPVEKTGDPFYLEYTILSTTTEAVNSFNLLYKAIRTGVKGGPSTHNQQDLYRAMLVFACAGLDMFVKQLINTKLPDLIPADKTALDKFKDYVKSGIKKDEKQMLNTVAFALIDQNPRSVFLKEYIAGMTNESLQSVDELYKVSSASGLDTKTIFDNNKRNLIRDAFTVRNEIIHEMDINVSNDNSNTTGYRKRRQRTCPAMEKHTKTILDLAQELFLAYKKKCKECNVNVEKGKSKTT
jgi:hypothetical protein